MVLGILLLFGASAVSAQEDEIGGGGASDMSVGGEGTEQKAGTFSVNGLIKMQTGIFVPLASNGFKEYFNRALDNEKDLPIAKPCDPVMEPDKSCFPRDHGQPAGSLSMFRTLFQLESDWNPVPKIAVHGMVRGVRSLMTDADGWAQMPIPSKATSGVGRRNEARQWVLDNYYNRFEIRELYLDVFPTDRISFRIGRQQVTWGETGQFRLLDVINPVDSTWHFAPVESYEDTRVPLWIVKGLIDFPNDQSLELVWVPGIDRPQDMVNTPLTFVGAWGVPYSNTPSPFLINEKRFLYPKNGFGDAMRAGLRWKGSFGNSMTYSLVYYYTHQISPRSRSTSTWCPSWTKTSSRSAGIRTTSRRSTWATHASTSPASASISPWRTPSGPW